MPAAIISRPNLVLMISADEDGRGVENLLLFLRVGDQHLGELREAGLVLLGRRADQLAQGLDDPSVLGEHPRQLLLERRDVRQERRPCPG